MVEMGGFCFCSECSESAHSRRWAQAEAIGSNGTTESKVTSGGLDWRLPCELGIAVRVLARKSGNAVSHSLWRKGSYGPLEEIRVEYCACNERQSKAPGQHISHVTRRFALAGFLPRQHGSGPVFVRWIVIRRGRFGYVILVHVYSTLTPAQSSRSLRPGTVQRVIPREELPTILLIHP